MEETRREGGIGASTGLAGQPTDVRVPADDASGTGVQVGDARQDSGREHGPFSEEYPEGKVRLTFCYSQLLAILMSDMGNCGLYKEALLLQKVCRRICKHHEDWKVTLTDEMQLDESGDDKDTSPFDTAEMQKK